MSRRRWMLCLLALTWVVPVLSGAKAETSSWPEAKDFTLVDITGRPRTLSALRGKVVVLSFWATWCGPCRLELPQLHEVYKRHKREAFEVYAISVDNGATVALVPALAAQMGLSFPVLLDTDNRVVMQYNHKGVIPYTVIVDRQGRIRHVHPGYAPGEARKVEQEIVQLLEETGQRPGKRKEGAAPG